MGTPWLCTRYGTGILKRGRDLSRRTGFYLSLSLPARYWQRLSGNLIWSPTKTPAYHTISSSLHPLYEKASILWERMIITLNLWCSIWSLPNFDRTRGHYPRLCLFAGSWALWQTWMAMVFPSSAPFLDLPTGWSTPSLFAELFHLGCWRREHPLLNKLARLVLRYRQRYWESLLRQMNLSGGVKSLTVYALQCELHIWW